MKKSRSLDFRSVLLTIGAVLVIGALVVVSYNSIASYLAEKKCEKIVEKIEKLIPEPISSFPEERGNNTMSSMQIEKMNVAGIIEMPQYDLKLPFCSSWDEKNSASVPCRFYGSVYDSSLIIGAVDSDWQFGFAKELELNNVLYLTDMEGYKYTYLIAKIEHSDSADAKKLMTDEYDLTLFIKRSLSMEYLIVRFNLKTS